MISTRYGNQTPPVVKVGLSSLFLNSLRRMETDMRRPSLGAPHPDARSDRAEDANNANTDNIPVKEFIAVHWTTVAG